MSIRIRVVDGENVPTATLDHGQLFEVEVGDGACHLEPGNCASGQSTDVTAAVALIAGDEAVNAPTPSEG